MSAETAEPTDYVPDLGPIMPDQARLVIEGIPVRVQHLRTREIFSLARVVGMGLGTSLVDMDVDFNNPDELKANIAGMLLVALPMAVEETLVFFRDVVRPVNSEDAARLRGVMANPELDDLLNVTEAIIDQDGDNLASLVGKALRLAPKVAKFLPETAPGPDGRGPGPSTSSNPSTDGQMSTS